MGDHPSPTKESPKGNLSVKERKAKLENKWQEKYRNQRNMKDAKKDANKFKGRACKKSTEVIEDPLAKMITTKLLAEIEPSLNGIKTQIENNVNQNLRRIVQEELMLQKMAESKSENEDKQEDEDEKNKKIQKKVKKKKDHQLRIQLAVVQVRRMVK